MLARLLPSLGSARLGQCRARQHGSSAVRVSMSTYRLPRGATLHLKEGDLTEFDGGAIVNAGRDCGKRGLEQRSVRHQPF